MSSSSVRWKMGENSVNRNSPPICGKKRAEWPLRVVVAFHCTTKQPEEEWNASFLKMKADGILPIFTHDGVFKAIFQLKPFFLLERETQWAKFSVLKKDSNAGYPKLLSLGGMKKQNIFSAIWLVFTMAYGAICHFKNPKAS